MMYFSTFLYDVMSARQITFDGLIHELAGVEPTVVQAWLDGVATPDVTDLPVIASALRTDLTEVAVGWLIDRLPEVHEPLYSEVLHARDSQFPSPSDLAVRAPAVRAANWRRMDVGDPHDEQPGSLASAEAGRRVRKRPVTRKRA